MKVVIYSTLSGERTVNTEATEWAELKRELRNLGISYTNMKAVVGETKVTLEADSTVLPTSPFTLFLMPKETKSGITEKQAEKMSYKEIRAAISAIIKKNSTAKNFFNEGGNYTRKGTEILRTLLIKYLLKPGRKIKETKGVSSTVAKAAEKASKKVKGFNAIETMDYRELRGTIQKLMHGKFAAEASSHFNKDKNYTLKKTEEMRKLLGSWKFGLGKDALKEVIEKSTKAKLKKKKQTKITTGKSEKRKKKPDFTMRKKYNELVREVPGVEKKFA